jgi:hypothetical protein
VKDSPVMIILLALLAVAGTLGGVWLGRYLERDNEALKWRRDHALEVYSEFIRAIEVAHAGSDRMYISEEWKGITNRPKYFYRTCSIWIEFHSVYFC